MRTHWSESVSLSVLLFPPHILAVSADAFANPSLEFEVLLDTLRTKDAFMTIGISADFA